MTNSVPNQGAQVMSGPLSQTATALLTAIKEHADICGVAPFSLHELHDWLQAGPVREAQVGGAGQPEGGLDFVLKPLMDELLAMNHVQWFFYSPDDEGDDFRQFLFVTSFDPSVACSEQRETYIPGWQAGDIPESHAARIGADYRSLGRISDDPEETEEASPQGHATTSCASSENTTATVPLTLVKARKRQFESKSRHKHIRLCAIPGCQNPRQLRCPFCSWHQPDLPFNGDKKS